MNLTVQTKSPALIETAAHLRQALELTSGIHDIKLKSLLEIGEELAIPKTYTASLPPIDIGSITLVDQVVLVLLAKIIQPTKIIEIGTYKGFTTRLFIENTPDTCEVVSIDLPRELTEHLSEGDLKGALVSAELNDDYLRKRQEVDGEVYVASITNEQRQRLRLVKQDSTKIDFKAMFETAEMIFIDGGHEHGIVAADTRNAFDVVKRGVVVWHDYSSNIHGDVSEFLEDFSKSHAVFHVANSLIAFSLVNVEIG
jgi:predicted O-methyltransferase YrrM